MQNIHCNLKYLQSSDDEVRKALKIVIRKNKK